jgi:translation elongation factor EF-Ts
MDQEWIQDKSKSIQTLLDEAKSSMGENVSIGRFKRIRVGEGQPPPAAVPAEKIPA